VEQNGGEEHFQNFDILRDYIMTMANKIPFEPTEIEFYDFLRKLLPDVIVTEQRVMRLFENLISHYAQNSSYTLLIMENLMRVKWAFKSNILMVLGKYLRKYSNIDYSKINQGKDHPIFNLMNVARDDFTVIDEIFGLVDEK
jgi:hypothetical protein